MSEATKPTHHFFGVSAVQWATTSDKRSLRDLIKLMEADKLTWHLWLVPLPNDAEYDINFYQPQVQGAQFLEEFKFVKGKKA